MLNQGITLAGDSSSTRTYNATQYDPFSERVATTNAGVTEKMTIKHSLGKLLGGVTDRRLVRLDQVRVNGTTGAQVGAAVYVVLEVPRDSTITSVHLKDMRTQVVNFLSNANLDALLAGEK